MRVGVIGINHKLADLKLRELLAKTCQRRFGPGQSTHGQHAFILLSTCNRTEVYFSSEDLASTHSYLLNILLKDIDGISEKFDQKLYSYFRNDCFLHLAKVTAGLDSAIVAETEIQGQVKSAYEDGAGFVRLPKELHFMFQKALKIGKQIRSKILVGRGIPDLEHAILNIGFYMFRQPTDIKILFVGASEINRKILAFLKGKNIQDITLCNRSHGSAMSLAEKYQLKTLGWQNLSNWHLYDWIIFGTKCPEYIVKRNDLPNHSMGHKLVIDLCVPRNVEPRLGRDPRITLLNIDQINRTLKIRRQKMHHIISQAEQLVNTATKRQIDIFQEKERNRKKYAIA